MREKSVSMHQSPPIRSLSTAVFIVSFIIVFWGSPSFGDTAGSTIVGRVTFQGSLPPPQQLKVNRDQDICGLTVTIQPLIVDESSRGVRDVVINVEGIKHPTVESDNGVEDLTNKGCAFTPRIGVVKVGQILNLRNEDPMLHNTHIRMGKRTFVNVAQVVDGRLIPRLVNEPGFMSVNCDKHKFMQGYVFVFDHPYFAITDETGQFRIEDLPPGRWKTTIWHETLGTVQTDVIVPEHGEVSVRVEYPAKRSEK
jgi:plastocyanin